MRAQNRCYGNAGEYCEARRFQATGETRSTALWVSTGMGIPSWVCPRNAARLLLAGNENMPTQVNKLPAWQEMSFLETGYFRRDI
jgi:hypothetical protein